MPVSKKNVSALALLFFSTSRKALALLEDLFRETFDLSLILQIPWNAALHMVDEEALTGLDDLRPAILI